MLSTIGIMIGAYIFTRMIELMMREDTGIILNLFATLTLLVAGVCLLLLFAGGMVTPNPMMRGF